MLARQAGQAERTRCAAQVRYADLYPSRTRDKKDTPCLTREGMGRHGLRKGAENDDTHFGDNNAFIPYFLLDY